jgi:hypothetical protein
LPEPVSNWQKLRRLNYSQWAVIACSPFVLWLNWHRLRGGGYQKTLELIPAVADSGAPAEQQLLQAQETAYALSVALKFGPWKPRCLLRSLALCWFLARRGIPYDIRIGVPGDKRMTGPDREVDFSAHAWVEHGGVVLNDRADIAAEFSIFEETRRSGFSRENRE